MKKIDDIRRWIEVCEKAGTPVPEEVYLLDAYARLLEGKLLSMAVAAEVVTAQGGTGEA